MHKYLPSKKFSIILLSLLAVLILFYAFSAFKKTREVNITLTKKVSNQAKNQEFVSLDTDGDGLKDWEENLWKTDPKNPDTDGDGTNDKEEIEQKRDPTIKGPKDEVDQQIIINNKKQLADFNKLTDTDKVSRTLLSSYLATKNSGLPLTEETKQLIVDNALSSLKNSPQAKIYKISDIKNIVGTDLEDFVFYTLNFDEIFKNATVEGTGEEMIYFSNAIKDNDPEELKKIDPIVLGYEKMISLLLNLPTPKGLEILHINFINSLEKTKKAVNDMTFLFTDPVKAMSGLQKYEGSLQEVSSNLNNIKKLLSDKAK